MKLKSWINFFATGMLLTAGKAEAQVSDPSSGNIVKYDYYRKAGTPPDAAIVPLGNATGRIMAFEIPGGLPIIYDIRSSMQNSSVIAGEKEFALNYHAVTGEERKDIRAWKGGGVGFGYPKSMILSDGLQPVISYYLNGKNKVCWPYDLKNYSREWVETTNVLKTVMRNDEIELTATDFVDTNKDMIVRMIEVKNISNKNLDSVKLFHYSPVNASGRKSTFGWNKDWYAIQSNNNSYYNAEHDCLLFGSEGSKWWVLGSDKKSIAYQCDTYPNSRLAINNGTLINKGASAKGLVDGALCYGNITLKPDAKYAANFFIACIDKKDSTAVLNEFKHVYRNKTAEERLNGTLLFWNSWFKKGNIPVTPDPKLNEYVKRELMLIKTQEYWTGGFPSDAFELPDYYFRDSSRPAWALALFGYPEEAKANMLALAAIAEKNGYCNHFHGIESWIQDGVRNGLPANATFKETLKYSADDPAVVLTVIGDIYRLTKDKTFAKKIWPLIPYTVAIAHRDMGKKGTVAQIQGFQDDMIHWAQQRPEVKNPGEKGVECTYWNMFWVAGIERAATIANDLGHIKEAKAYQQFAKELRTNIEERFWDKTKKRYPYYYDPNKNEFIYLVDNKLNHGGGIAIQSGYLKPQDPKAKSEWQAVKTATEPIPSGDAIIQKYSASGVSISRYLFQKVYSGDDDVKKTFNWYVENVPFSGLSEYLPFHHRVQVWTRGEMLMSIYEFIKIYYPESIKRK